MTAAAITETNSNATAPVITRSNHLKPPAHATATPAALCPPPSRTADQTDSRAPNNAAEHAAHADTIARATKNDQNTRYAPNTTTNARLAAAEHPSSQVRPVAIWYRASPSVTQNFNAAPTTTAQSTPAPSERPATAPPARSPAPTPVAATSRPGPMTARSPSRSRLIMIPRPEEVPAGRVNRGCFDAERIENIDR